MLLISRLSLTDYSSQERSDLKIHSHPQNIVMDQRGVIEFNKPGVLLQNVGLMFQSLAKSAAIVDYFS